MATLAELMAVLDRLAATAREGAVERSLATEEERWAYGTDFVATTADYQKLVAKARATGVTDEQIMDAYQWGCRNHGNGTAEFTWDGTVG